VPERRKRATIRELAAHTGLSPAAVSYALRGLHVAPETAERVREAAAEIGYEADPIARALRGGATGVVGVLVSSLADFWIQELTRAVQSALRDGGRHTLVADADGDPERELELAQRLVDQRVDGLVIVPLGPPSDGFTAVAASVPTVTVGNELTGVPVAGRVVFDTARGVADTLRHLAAEGHRRIALLSWAVEISPGQRAERAAAAYAEELGLRCEIVPCAYSLNGSRPLAVEVLRRRRNRPTALFCLSDSIAYGVYAACAELGLAIPRDVAVAGFDDHPISRLLTPALTSTAWGVDRVAATAVGFLETSLEDGDRGERRVMIPPQLQPRGSTRRA
jgi:LacI family transcriptional regulator, galactose operon repressor